MAFGAVGGEFGLVLHPRTPGRILHQQEGLLGLAVSHDALLVLRLADALQAQIAPAAQNEGAQGSDGDEGDDDGHHPRGGAVVHDGHGGARGRSQGAEHGVRAGERAGLSGSGWGGVVIGCAVVGRAKSLLFFSFLQAPQCNLEQTQENSSSYAHIHGHIFEQAMFRPGLVSVPIQF